MSGRQAAAVDGSPLISAVARSKACDYSSPASKTHIVCLFAELGGRMGTYAELRRLLELLASFPTTEATDRRRLQVQFVFRFRFTFPLTVHLSHCLLFVHGLRREKTSKFILCPICLQLWVISSLFITQTSQDLEIVSMPGRCCQHVGVLFCRVPADGFRKDVHVLLPAGGQ